MTQQKSCSGSNTIVSWALASALCDYGIQLVLDGTNITSVVTENSGVAPAQIELDLMANRINGFTGTITVALVGNDLVITLSNVVIPATSGQGFDLQVSTQSGGCPSFSTVQTSLSCTVIPQRNKKKKIGALPACMPVMKQTFPNGALPYINFGGAIYYYTGEDNLNYYYCTKNQMNQQTK